MSDPNEPLAAQSPAETVVASEAISQVASTGDQQPPAASSSDNQQPSDDPAATPVDAVPVTHSNAEGSSGDTADPLKPPSDDTSLWVYRKVGSDTWTPFSRDQQRLLEEAYWNSERVVDLVFDNAECLVDLKTNRMMGHSNGVIPIKRRAPPAVLAEKRKSLAECRAIMSSIDNLIEEYGGQLKTTFAEWRAAIDQRETATLMHIESLRNEYRAALTDAHEMLVCMLADAGYELEGERLMAPAELLKLTFKNPTDKSFIIRRTDEGLVLKWREPSKAATASPKTTERSGDRSPSSAKAASITGDYYFVTAMEAVHMSRRSWAFRFDKGRYIMAGVVRADPLDHCTVPWKGDAFLWQLNFCTTNGGKLGTVAPGLINHPPIKPGSVVTFTYDAQAATLSCSVGVRRSVVVGTNIRGPVVPAFVLHRGEEITVLHNPLL